MWPMRGMCGATEVEVEVQRTHKRAGACSLLCLPRRIIGLTTAQVDDKRIIDLFCEGK